MALDFLLTGARMSGSDASLVDIGIRGETIAAIAPAGTIAADCEVIALRGQLIMPGFVETHIHLDKSCVIDRCDIQQGTLLEAITETARVKREFSEPDIASRAVRTLEKSIVAGTQLMRTHVEVDPRIGLKGFNAVRRVARDYAWAIDIEVCVFPQEGMLNDPGTEDLLITACEQGAGAIGGCPYADTHPVEHIARIFDIARRFDLDIDFHLDFDLDASWMHLTEVCKQARARKYEGRVAVGHVTKLSALPMPQLVETARLIADSGVAVTVLPATDLFLMGREHDHNVPRGVSRADILMQHGVTCSLATNNVLNAFTPFGDCSLTRIANLYANAAQLGRREDLARCMEMISTSAAKLMNRPLRKIELGAPADPIVLPCPDGASAVSEIVQPVFGFKAGRRSFSRAPAVLFGPMRNATARS